MSVLLLFIVFMLCTADWEIFVAINVCKCENLSDAKSWPCIV